MTVAARPEGGKANKEVVERLAGLLGVPAGEVRIVSGPTDRRKSVLVACLGPEGVLERIARHIKRQPSAGKARGAMED